MARKRRRHHKRKRAKKKIRMQPFSGTSSLIIPRVDASSIPDVGEAVLAEMFRAERERMIDPNYFSRQTKLNPRMRALLIDWLIELAEEVGFITPSVIYGAIQYLDAYLSKTNDAIARCKFQLLGAVCLFLAHKIDCGEYCLPWQLFVESSAGAFEQSEGLPMETALITSLDWNLSVSGTPYHFMMFFLQRLSIVQRERFLNEFSLESKDQESQERLWMMPPLAPHPQMVRICEMLDAMVLDVNSLCFLPSMLAATVLTFYFGSHPEDAMSVHDVTQATGYLRDDLADCIECFDYVTQLAPRALKQIPPRHIQAGIRSIDRHAICQRNPNALPLVVARSLSRCHPAAERNLQKMAVEGR